MDLTNKSMIQSELETQKKEIEQLKEVIDKKKKENSAFNEKLQKSTTEKIQTIIERDQYKKNMEGAKKSADELHKEIKILVQKREASVKAIHEKNNLLEAKEKEIT